MCGNPIKTITNTVGGLLGINNAPKPPELPAPTPQQEQRPQQSDQAIQDEKSRDRRRNAARGGRQSTILTNDSGSGDQSGGSTGQSKTALGA